MPTRRLCCAARLNRDAGLRWHDGERVIALLLLAAGAASPAPVLHSAEARSIAYRDCVTAQHRRRPAAASVAQIGRGPCAAARSKLVARVDDFVSYGWAATAKTERQARRLRAHQKQQAEAQVAAFEGKLQAWLAEPESGHGDR